MPVDEQVNKPRTLIVYLKFVITFFFYSSVLLSQLFGDAILTRAKLKFLFTHKFLFVRYYQEVSLKTGYISVYFFSFHIYFF